jgi:hypothetical protein
MVTEAAGLVCSTQGARRKRVGRMRGVKMARRAALAIQVRS